MKYPYVSFATGDFNAKNLNWWGNINDQIAGMYRYNQIIDEPTNFEPHHV